MISFHEFLVLIFSIFLARYLLFSDLNFPLNTKDYESNILTTTPFRLCSGRMRQRFRRWRFETLELRSSSIIHRASWGNRRVQMCHVCKNFQTCWKFTNSYSVTSWCQSSPKIMPTLQKVSFSNIQNTIFWFEKIFNKVIFSSFSPKICKKKLVILC